jgi:rhamnosyltransferase
MIANGVCAVIITFRPSPVVSANIAKTRLQVQGLVVVDNASPLEALAPTLAASRELNFEMIRNGANLGVAAALNIGVKWARSQGHSFVALFDQDSGITEGFVPAMLEEYESSSNREMVAIVTPRHLEHETGEWDRPAMADDGSPLVAITSGSLMPLSIFDRCGWFEEDLIIDRVDDEYCLRARSMGYTIALCHDAVLHHSVGSPRVHSFLGIRQVKATHHGAKRYYYLSRNRIVMVKRYWRKYPRWSYLTARSVVRDLIVNFVVEGDRWRKLGTTLRGIVDGLCGRMGMVIQL